MKANELIHGGLYLIHDTSDIIVRYDIVSNSFRSEWYEYPLALFHDDVCATDGDRHIFVKPIPLTIKILKANGWNKNGAYNDYIIRGDIYNFIGYNTNNKHVRIRIDGWKALQEMYVSANFVHELQNALRLCGFNDLADNFKVTE